MANTSASHIITDFTITAGTTAEQKFATRTPCAWFVIRNNEAGTVLSYKTSDANSFADAIDIAAGASKEFPVLMNSANGYNLAEYRFLSTLVGHSFTIEYVKA